MIDTKLGRKIQLNAGTRDGAEKGLFEVMTTGAYTVFKKEMSGVVTVNLR